MSFHIRLYIKFRFLRITLGTLNKQWSIMLAPMPGFEDEPVNVPEGASTIYNDRGVILQVWKDA